MKLRFIQTAILCLSVCLASPMRAESQYRPYPIDFEPLKKHPEQAANFDRLLKKFETTPLTLAEHEFRMQQVAQVLEREPQWLDGYWIYAADAYFLGSLVTDPKQHAESRAILEKGVQKLKECVKRDPKNLLCRFFTASLQAKIASIDGIFASLKLGKSIRDVWLEVTKAPYDIAFRPNVTLQGSALFALGLFYRLVPDNVIMEWFWDVRGNIDTSIRYHREALRHDPQNPCAHLMLAVALLCKVHGDPQSPLYTEAMKLLDSTEREKSIDVAQDVCIADAPRLRKEPKKTCGYTQAKYQDEVKPEDLPKR